MMKILHSADWHLDAPILGHSEEDAAYLRQELLKIPGKLIELARKEGCGMMLLAGDLFDGKPTAESLRTLLTALEEIKIPVVITPGNHDFCRPDSPYLTTVWPENVHIFTHPVLESLDFPELSCTVYGAGYEAMDCPPLLKDFRADSSLRWKIGVLHGDPTQSSSPYCPVTNHQVKESGLQYLALGHIHKGGSFRAGDCLCAWPGCPMGKGYDETGIKGALIVTLDDSVTAEFRPLDTPRFYDEEVDVGEDASAAVASLLPPAATQDFYRVTLTGYTAPVDTAAITASYPDLNLELRDRTLPEMDLWNCIDEDSLEGTLFHILHDAMDTESDVLRQRIKLAAKISRQILDGQEVTLP
ncbi:MAG: exonuclease SbcCD subunit D [Faecousia sp.]